MLLQDLNNTSIHSASHGCYSPCAFCLQNLTTGLESVEKVAFIGACPKLGQLLNSGADIWSCLVMHFVLNKQFVALDWIPECRGMSRVSSLLNEPGSEARGHAFQS